MRARRTGNTDVNISSVVVIKALKMVETTHGEYIEKSPEIPKCKKSSLQKLRRNSTWYNTKAARKEWLIAWGSSAR